MGEMGTFNYFRSNSAQPMSASQSSEIRFTLHEIRAFMRAQMRMYRQKNAKK
jgi:hypothetical protein